jgi:hypothetical protein
MSKHAAFGRTDWKKKTKTLSVDGRRLGRASNRWPDNKSQVLPPELAWSVDIIQGHYFIWPIAFLTSYKDNYRTNNRWAACPHVWWNKGRKLQTIFFTQNGDPTYKVMTLLTKWWSYSKSDDPTHKVMTLLTKWWPYSQDDDRTHKMMTLLTKYKKPQY